MRISGLALLALVFNLRAWSQTSNNVLSPEEKKAGWQLLFDGSTLNGWHGYNNAAVAGKWEVSDGTIHMIDRDMASRASSHDLITNDSYDDFDLKAEWQVAQGTNSGIMFHVQEGAYDAPYKTGPEMQVLDNEGNPNGRQPNGRAGSLYGMIPCTPDNARPPGQWNQVEILCRDGVLKFFQNGVNVVTTSIGNDSWSQLVATYYTRWPDYGTFRSGKIDLQDWTGEVWFRNIKIKKFAAATGPGAHPSATTSPGAHPSTASMPERSHTNQGLVGLWQVFSISPGLKAIPLFSNDFFEFHTHKLGVSVNEKSNSAANVRFFMWDFNRDTLYIDTLINGAQKVRVAVATVRIDKDTVYLHVATINKLTGRPVFNPDAVMTITNSSNDEFSGYYDYMGMDTAGRWLKAYEFKDGRVVKQSDQYWDIYPSNSNYGEIIMHPVHPSGGAPMAGMNFVKYNFSQVMFAAAFMKTNPNRTKSDTTKHYDLNNLADRNEKLPYLYCHVSDGTAMLEDESGQITYLVYTGPAGWADPGALHVAYNSQKHVELQQFGVHVQWCAKCRGTGTVSEEVQNSSPDREAVGSEYGRTIYREVYHTHFEHNTCGVCEGKGWFYENDDEPVQYQAYLKYSTVTGIDASEEMPAGFVKINNLYTASFMKNENGFSVCKNTNYISWREQWQIIPVKGTGGHVLFRNRVNGSFLCSTPQHGTTFSKDSTSQAAMWLLTIDPNADLLGFVRNKVMKIMSVANDNEVLYTDGNGLGTGNQWDHLASSMWNVNTVEGAELSQEYPK